MNREEEIRKYFTQDMRLIEIGPSYTPIVPKAAGWRTTVVDHAPQAELVAKYSSMGVTSVDRIEPVDYVWQHGPISELIAEDMYGQYDGLISSHVCEHLPDLIGFFKCAAKLIKPDGMLALALPDKRVCFDFFQPLTTTGDLVAAHSEGRTRHARRTFFNQAAYYTTRDGAIGWAHNGTTGPLHLANPLSLAQSSFDEADDNPSSEYRDTHAWYFTPKSFELLLLELNLLGHIDWAIREIKPALGIEFYAWLERKKLAFPQGMVNPTRLGLLTEMMRETQTTLAEVLQEPGFSTSKQLGTRPPPDQKPRIAVIIPLYNGARFIEGALLSVFRQTLPASEIIVINDGSTDQGAGVAIVERMAQNHCVTLLHKLNGGQSSARNAGVQHAQSDFIALLDQDDVWYENHLEELIKPFLSDSARPIGAVYSDLDEIDENGQVVTLAYLETLNVKHPKRTIFDCIGQDMFILPSASLIRRDVIIDIGGFDEGLCGYEDDDLFMRLFRRGYRLCYLNQSLSQWRIYPTSISYTYRMSTSRAVYMRKLLESFPNDPLRARYYVRDLIAPRFFNQMLNEYHAAVASFDKQAASLMWDAILELVNHEKVLASHLVVPALNHYKDALTSQDGVAIKSAWRRVVRLLDLVPNRHRRLRAVLHLLQDPQTAKRVFALRNLARPAMLWAFRT